MENDNTTSNVITNLITEFSKLPGIGPKSAQRLTYYMVKITKDQAFNLSKAIAELKEKILSCSECFNITEQSPCGICSSETRDTSIICVVEQPIDVIHIERTGVYNGLYHVLNGVISPINGIGPENLKINEFFQRIFSLQIKEVILATNPSMEGEVTSMYINNFLSEKNIKTSVLARGLPIGSDLEYTDDLTLVKALEGRKLLE
ncbi:MAG: recombination protein RecR [SAR202 cluster bacterium]|nr:recombination protein RecR [SAR202 cluster bacterium]|tara:strand:- start:48790 stop:49401 length:612 start_codon:yes stop_codon:yes gene_type:complete